MSRNGAAMSTSAHSECGTTMPPPAPPPPPSGAGTARHVTFISREKINARDATELD